MPKKSKSSTKPLYASWFKSCDISGARIAKLCSRIELLQRELARFKDLCDRAQISWDGREHNPEDDTLVLLWPTLRNLERFLDRCNLSLCYFTKPGDIFDLAKEDGLVTEEKEETKAKKPKEKEIRLTCK